MGSNVKELLEELKNLSELMLDLAYSAVFFKNKIIAKEVVVLYNELEELEEDLYMHLFAVSKKMSKRLISVIELVETLKSVAMAAKNLSEIVLDDKLLHPIIKDVLKESDESISKTKISKKSVMVNKTLGGMKFRSNTGIDVIAIKRGRRWIFDPKKNTKIHPEDTLITVGSVESCEIMVKLASGKQTEI